MLKADWISFLCPRFKHSPSINIYFKFKSILIFKSYNNFAKVNKIEAQGKPFQRNWRPSVGWICSFALGYHFVLAPIIEVIIKTSGIQIEMPEFDFSQLSAILMALLGMSGLRSYDKLKKTDTKG